MTQSSTLLALVLISSLLCVRSGVIPASDHPSPPDNFKDHAAAAPKRGSASDSDPDYKDPHYNGVIAPTDRVLRPRVEWIGSGKPSSPSQTCEAGDDYCDNGGSTNCALCEKDFDTTEQKREDLVPRMITGNGTYQFLPGESVLVRKIGKRTVHDLIFNCNPNCPDNLKEVCENMCYGLNCLQISNHFTREMNKGQCTANRKANACGKQLPNQCSRNYKGPNLSLARQSQVPLSCDEFPFASTEQSQTIRPAVTRCVPAKHNSMLLGQGGKIGAFYRYTLKPQDSFRVMFDYTGGNAEDSTHGPSSYRYCKPGTYNLNQPICQRDIMQLS
ncbi:hypothetical protein B0H19DRAFT_1234162 [Mycena capillaripes]|nr:hypothetical protein B0H19DRAFT_1234162 [Mycena capillaripes]